MKISSIFFYVFLPVVEKYSEIFGLIQFFGFFLAPITGIVMNIQPRNISNTYFGPMMSFIITMLLCLILGILVLLPVLEIQVSGIMYYAPAAVPASPQRG